MRKIILGAVFGAFLLIFFLCLSPGSWFYPDLMSFLTQDKVSLKDGKVIYGWVWDEKNGIVIGETKDKELFVFKNSEIFALEKDKNLNYLGGMI